MLKQLIQPLWFVRLALQCSYEPPSLLTTILRHGGHLHEMPQALTVKDIKRRAATYNRSHDDLMRAATLQGFSPALQHQLLQSALQSLPRIPVTRQALVHQAITKDLAIFDL
jgi:hypothetical protein